MTGAATLANQLAGGRYRVVRELGRGGMAVVLEARDTWLGERAVALKLAQRDIPSAGTRLGRELALLYRVSHPCLMRVFGSGELAAEAAARAGVDPAFLVLELCTGASALEWARQVSAEHVAGLGCRVAAGLAALHALGVRHGDVTPDNIRVAPDGACKLIDFGLADVGAGTVAAGALRTMAPEAIAGAPTVASDIYGLAATLADLLGVDVDRAPGAQLTSTALGEALAAMSHPDAARRVSAVDAIALLSASADANTRDTIAAMRDAPPSPSLVVGRDAVVEALVAPGRHGVSGARGIGKTAVLTACAARAFERGYRVPGGVHAAADGSLDVVVRALHELGGPLPASPERSDDPIAQRYAQLASLAQALTRAAAQRPLALIFDDVPPGSPLDALGDFLVRSNVQKLAWIESKSGAATILEPLDASAVAALVRAARPLRPLDTHAASAVYAMAGGHPAATLALLAAYPGDSLVQAATRGALEARAVTALDAATRSHLAAIAVFKRGAPTAVMRDILGEAALAMLIDRGLVIPRGPTLETSQSLELGDLDPALAKRLGEAIARHSEPDSIALAYVALAQNDLASAEPHALTGGDRAERELRHAEAYAVYEAVYARAPSSALAFASARAAIALGRFDEALVRVSAASDHPEQRALAADALITLGRYSEADALLSPPATDGEPEARLAATRARALMLAGRYEDAQRFAEERLSANAHDPRRVDLMNVAGVSRFFTGHAERGRALLTEALTLATDARTIEATRANLALVLHRSGELKAAEDAYTRCVADLEARGDLPRKLLRLTNLAILRQELGSFATALASYEEAAQLARLTANDRALVRVLLNLANLAAWLGNHGEAAPFLAEATVIADRLALTVERAYLRLVAAEIAIANGDTATAMREIDAAEKSLDKGGLCEARLVRAEAGTGDISSAIANGVAHEAHAAGRERLELRARIVACVTAGAATLDPRMAELAERSSDPDLTWMAFALEARGERARGTPARAREREQSARRQLAAARAALPARYDGLYTTSRLRQGLIASLGDGDAARSDGIASRDFDRLLAINRELARDHDPERLLERIIDAAIALSGAERGFLLLKEPPDEQVLQVRTARSLDARELKSDELDISRSIAREVIANGAPLSAIDAREDARFRDYRSVHSLSLRSVLCLPLRAGSATLGAIYLDHRYRASAFTDTDVALLAAFGDQAAIALANARMLSELEERNSELERSRAEIDELNQRLGKELAAREAEIAATRKLEPEDDSSGRHGMIGRTPAMRDIFRVIDRIADKDVPVTISGESGTGKELVARAIHAGSSSRTGPFVPVNCGAIPENLLESELFGHERGAFTGAVRAKPGLFEIARGGTIFLDEIGDMPLGMQVKLLRVLQTREFRRVGGTQDIATDARVLSATNRDLESLVRDGRFREDLWYRLNVVEIRVPALRERREDLPYLIEHLLGIHARGAEVKLSRKARAALLDYAWPGNVRELDNELQRAIALADEMIEPDVFSAKLQAKDRAQLEEPTAGTLKVILDRHERDVIRATLAEHKGRVAPAARALGLTRAGLYKKMHKLGISEPKRD